MVLLGRIWKGKGETPILLPAPNRHVRPSWSNPSSSRTPIVAFDPIGPIHPLAPNRRIRPDWSDPSTPRLGMNSKLWVSSVFTEGGRGHAPQLRGLCPTRWQPFLSGAKRKQIRDKEESTDKTDHHRTPFAF